MSVSLIVLGALLHLSALLLRALATGRVPWGNMYEFGATLSLAAVVTWLVLLRRFPIRSLSVWLLLPVIVLMFLGGVVLYTTAAPVQPALQSYWLAIHVFAIALGSGMVLVPGVVSVLYLVKTRRPQWATRLPDAQVLDQVAYRTTVFAFPIYTAGVIFGAIWAESAWGRFWGWDPKETVAFVAWVVYAAYLHSRATAGWRGGRAAVINIVGFAVDGLQPVLHQPRGRRSTFVCERLTWFVGQFLARSVPSSAGVRRRSPVRVSELAPGGCVLSYAAAYRRPQ